LVKHIVVAHQGKITVRSKPGEGATFTIQLPVADLMNERQEGLASSEGGVGEQSA
jgi:light-regulated signal transduction histidine kinase (bacteriophytochrome)